MPGDVDSVRVDVRNLGQNEIERCPGVGKPRLGVAKLAGPFEQGGIRGSLQVRHVAVNFERRHGEASPGIGEVLGTIAIAQIHADE